MKKRTKLIDINELLKSHNDPCGSYTGVCDGFDDEPEQDADDL